MENVQLDIAIIIPVYNASEYLRECLDSVCAQTYTNWSCILVNDGSTDNSQQIIDEYCARDKRFFGLVKKNERSAALARRFALERTNAEWIIQIDADDAVAHNFIEKLVERQLQTGADSVSWRMIRCKDGLNGIRWTLPDENFDMNQILSGRDCCLLTIGGWKISSVGLVRKSILLKIHPGPYMNSDEYEQRELLLLVNRKAFADAHYYYRANTATSYSVSVRMFDRTLVDMQLEQFVYDNFPEREDKIRALAWQRLFNLIYLTADYNIHKKEFTPEEQKKAVGILRKSYNAINRKTARQAAPIQSMLLTHSFTLFNILATAYVRYKRSHGGNFYYR